jgi:hypothetical protein
MWIIPHCIDKTKLQKEKKKKKKPKQNTDSEPLVA